MEIASPFNVDCWTLLLPYHLLSLSSTIHYLCADDMIFLYLLSLYITYVHPHVYESILYSCIDLEYNSI